MKSGSEPAPEPPALEPASTPNLDLSLNIGQPPLSSRSVLEIDSSAYMIERQRQMEMERVIERQNLQHKTTMDTLNATANLLAQTVAIMGVKAANDVRREEGGWGEGSDRHSPARERKR